MTVSRAVSLRISAKLGISVVKVRNWLWLLPRSERLTHIGCYARTCVVGKFGDRRVLRKESLRAGHAREVPDRSERALRARQVIERREAEANRAISIRGAELRLEDGFRCVPQCPRTRAMRRHGENERPYSQLLAPDPIAV